jgi:hypothetical protein
MTVMKAKQKSIRDSRMLSILFFLEIPGFELSFRP